jgi:hypothetical protein
LENQASSGIFANGYFAGFYCQAQHKNGDVLTATISVKKNSQSETAKICVGTREL